MAATKSLASSTAGLLARKGQARPALCPSRMDAIRDHADWSAPSAAESLLPIPRERATLASELEGRAAALSFETVKRLQHETAREGRAAFTLRLDQERHLRLRLAAKVHGRSAQQLVTAALDAFLTNLPHVEALVAQLPPRPNR